MLAEQVTDAVAYHGEGPVKSERWGGLRWVDMLAGDVLSLAADGRSPTARRDLLKGPAKHWIETVRRFALERGFDTFVVWPEDEPLVQLERFAEAVVPAVRR